MNSDRIEGTANKAVGKVQEKVGEFVGDQSTRLEGAARHAAGTAQDFYGQASDQIKGAACEVMHRVERNPLAALAIAGAVGYVIGVLCRSSRD